MTTCLSGRPAHGLSLLSSMMFDVLISPICFREDLRDAPDVFTLFKNQARTTHFLLLRTSWSLNAFYDHSPKGLRNPPEALNFLNFLKSQSPPTSGVNQVEPEMAARVNEVPFSRPFRGLGFNMVGFTSF